MDIFRRTDIHCLVIWGYRQNGSFDYGLVSSETAGLTVAFRLTADPSVNVAGGVYDANSVNIGVVPGYGTVFAWIG